MAAAVPTNPKTLTTAERLAHAKRVASARRQQTKHGRRILLFLVACYYVTKTFHQELWPFGRPVAWPQRRNYAELDYNNDWLQSKHGKVCKINSRLIEFDKETPRRSLMKGTQTIVLDKKGNMYGMTEQATLIRLHNIQTTADEGLAADVSVVKDSLGVGRPFGGAFAKDGQTLYMADAVLGLTRLQHPMDPHSKVELVANRITLDDGTVSKLLYTNDIALGPVSGKVYFTDSSNAYPTRVGTRTWDTMYAAKVDIFRALPTGRLLEYDPATDNVSLLASGLHFPSGLAVNGDESYLVIAETSAMRLLKYHLKGPQSGQVEVLLSHLPGYPTGLSCAPDGRCFAVMPSAIVPLHKLTAKLPDFLDILLRHLLLALPRQWTPKFKPLGGLVQVDAATGEYQYYLDPVGQDIAHLSSATYHDGVVYLGSMTNEYIAVFTPDKK